MDRPVWVTRPAREAAAWVHTLQAQGLQARALPLIEIYTLPHHPAVWQAWADVAHYQAVMLVSANAVAGFFEARACMHPERDASSLPPLPLGLRFWATGPGTVRALLQAGVRLSDIDAPSDAAPSYDSEALWEIVQASVRPGSRVLIVRGTDSHQARAEGVGRDWLTRALQQAGASVDTVASYARHCPVWGSEQRALAQAADAVWLFSSSEAVANLCQLLPQHSWAASRAVATHPRIAQAAQKAGFGVVITSQPALSQVMQTIKSLA